MNMFFQLPMYNKTSRDWRDISYFNIPDGDWVKNIFLLVTSDVLIPLISLLGLAGNVLSMVILYKNGLKKCSNVLIFHLAIADTIYLVGSNNIPLEIYLNLNIRFGYFISETSAYFLYCLFHVFVLMETVGKVVSMVLPTLIIAERFTAVYFPIRFARIFTVRRVRISALAIFPLGVPVYILFTPLSTFVYTLDPASNQTAGLIIKSQTYSSYSQIFTTASEVYSAICGPCCVGFVSVGCVLISAKIQLQMRERKLMSISGNNPITRKACLEHSVVTLSERTGHLFLRMNDTKETSQVDLPKTDFMLKSKNVGVKKTAFYSFKACQRVLPKSHNETPKILEQRRVKRTTKMLLSVCIVYSITGTFNFLCDMAFSSRTMPYNTSLIIHRMGILVLCVNSAANFVIYVVFNRNFRETYKQLMCCSQ